MPTRTLPSCSLVTRVISSTSELSPRKRQRALQVSVASRDAVDVLTYCGLQVKTSYRSSRLRRWTPRTSSRLSKLSSPVSMPPACYCMDTDAAGRHLPDHVEQDARAIGRCDQSADERHHPSCDRFFCAAQGWLMLLSGIYFVVLVMYTYGTVCCSC